MAHPADELVVIRTMANEFTAGIIRAQLEEAGIEASLSAGDSHSLGVFGSTGMAPTAVWVRRDRVEEAERVLEEVREESLDIDWSEVDVGEPDPGDRLAQRIASGQHPSLLSSARPEVYVMFGAALALAAFGVWLGALAALTLAAIGLVRTHMVRRKRVAAMAERPSE